MSKISWRHVHARAVLWERWKMSNKSIHTWRNKRNQLWTYPQESLDTIFGRHSQHILTCSIIQSLKLTFSKTTIPQCINKVSKLKQTAFVSLHIVLRIVFTLSNSLFSFHCDCMLFECYRSPVIVSLVSVECCETLGFTSYCVHNIRVPLWKT